MAAQAASPASANGLIPIDAPESVRPTDIAYLSSLPDLIGGRGIEGLTEAGIRYRASLEISTYNDHYTAIRISFERPVRGFGLLAAVSGYFASFGSLPQVGLTAGGAVIDVGSGGYVGFVSPTGGVSSVLLTSRYGLVSSSHLDLRPEPLARDDRITITTGETSLVSPDRLLGNDSLASGAYLVDPPSHAEVFHLSPDGLLTYRPAPGFLGMDRFSYRAVDSTGESTSNPAWVEVEVVEAAVVPKWTMEERLELLEDAGPQAFAGWASLEGFGDVEFWVTSNRPSLFHSQPSIDSEGTLRFETARDASGEAVLSVALVDSETGRRLQSKSISLMVQPIDDAPMLEPISVPVVEAGQAMVVQVRATEVDEGQIVRYRLQEGPEDAWIDPIAGLLVWRPKGPQRQRFVVRAVEGQGEALYAEQAFEVQVEPKILPPLLVAPTRAATLPGQPVRLRVASDRPGDRFFLGSDEAGATLNPETGQFQWTPSAKHAGSTVRFLVTAVRGNLCSTAEMAIQVSNLETRGVAAMKMGGAKLAKDKPRR